ncbi:XRE family transcriptional regulator [Streptomyces sp. NPDC052701]|uniref:nSTAND1 domain-containing NTPase n=1 Tax=Streptomyces sp. NPDC052701 TaxID=3155533 RepID=UPI0034187EB0
MPRRERPLDVGDGPLLKFAADLRRLRQRAGSPTYRKLAERAHYSVATLSEAAAGRRLPTLAVTLAYVAACDGDVGQWRERWQAVAAELATSASETGETARTGRDGAADGAGEAPPYRGLAAFEAEDADWFFGRERLVEEVMARLEDSRFVAVFGASGAGKSSLLRAGVVPRWQAAHAERRTVVFVPGPHPLRAGAARLAPLTTGSVEETRAGLAADDQALHRVVRQALAGQGENAELLLVVDQFEEVFTLCRDGGERARFIQALVTAARAEGSRCRVVLGVRADFYPHCTRHRELLEACGGAQVAVGPLTTDELRRAITGPAVRAGCTLEGALLAELVVHAHGQVGVLPLLSHALLETWRRRRGNTLTLTGFQAAGGIEGALARTAESVYTGLSASGRRAAKEVFLRLCALGEGTEDTKRRIARDEVDGSGPDTAVVLERLAAARLLTLDHDSVEISHEALIRCWPRLHDWLTQDRDSVRVHRLLTEAAQAWAAAGRDPEALLRGSRLALVNEWSAGAARPTNALERAFLDASRAAEAAEQSAARRRVRRMRHLIALLSVLLTVASIATVAAVRAQHKADQQRDIATSQRVAEHVRVLRSADPALSLQLSLAAYRLSPTVEARGSLLSAFTTPYATELAGHRGELPVLFSPDGRLLATGCAAGVRLWDATDPRRPRAVATLPAAPGDTAPSEAVRATAFSPDGRLLLTGDPPGDRKHEDRPGALRLWDITDPRRPRPLPVRRTPLPVSAAFSPDGRTLATVGQDGALRLWSPSRRHGLRPLTSLPPGPATGTGRLTSVAFGPDGRTLVAGSTDRTVRRWDTSRPRRPRPLPALRGHRGAVASVAFSPDGRTLATGGWDHTVRLWAVTGRGNVPRAVTLTGHTDKVHHVAFGPDGRSLASGGVEGVRLWTLHGAGRPYQAAHLTGHNDAVSAVAFAPDGSTLVSGSRDGTARLWDLATDTLTAHSSSVYAVAAAPRGRLLASASYDGTVRLWSAKEPHAVRELASPAGHTAAVNALAFTSDGETLISGSLDGTARLWSVTDPRRPRPLGTLTAHGAVDAVAVSPDGRTAVTADDEGARLWDITDPHRPRRTALLPGTAESLAFAPDGRTLATGGADGTIRLWTLASPLAPRGLGTLQGHTQVVKSLSFRPDGRLLASAGDDRTARLWPLVRGRPGGRPTVLTGHAEPLHAVGFGPDGRTLATAGNDDRVRLWRVPAGRRAPEELATLTGHTGDVNAVAFTPDGRALATASNDRTVRLWDPDPERVSARVCRTARPPVTRGQWRQHLPGTPYRPPCG